VRGTEAIQDVVRRGVHNNALPCGESGGAQDHATKNPNYPKQFSTLLHPEIPPGPQPFRLSTLKLEMQSATDSQILLLCVLASALSEQGKNTTHGRRMSRLETI